MFLGVQKAINEWGKYITTTTTWENAMLPLAYPTTHLAFHGNTSAAAYPMCFCDGNKLTYGQLKLEIIGKAFWWTSEGN